MPPLDPDFIARLAEGWYGRTLDAGDAAGIADALSPVEAAMAEEAKKVGFEDMNLARFAASLDRLADD